MAKAATAKRSRGGAARKRSGATTATRKRAAKKSHRAARPAPARRRKPKPMQKFVASHLHDTAFAEGLRRYAHYRDLGISDATHGMVQAHVIRFVPPCRPEEVSKLHFHDVEFQMVYVLKGWIKSEFEGHGAHTFHAGGCWLQPPRIKHKVLGYSDDCEVLEIILPAEFKTVELE